MLVPIPIEVHPKVRPYSDLKDIFTPEEYQQEIKESFTSNPIDGYTGYYWDNMSYQNRDDLEYFGFLNFSIKDPEKRNSHFNFFGKLGRGYGSVDSIEQFDKKFRNILEKSDRKLIVTFREIDKKEDGYYRFHKNGPYLGDCIREEWEYLKDEPNLGNIFQFNIYIVK
jgi:hypothetical protein